MHPTQLRGMTFGFSFCEVTVVQRNKCLPPLLITTFLYLLVLSIFLSTYFVCYLEGLALRVTLSFGLGSS